MKARSHTLTVSTRGRGLHDITRELEAFVRSLSEIAPGPEPWYRAATESVWFCEILLLSEE